MNNDNETQIVWRLSKADKGRYVAAARAHLPPLPLVGWLKKVADAASGPVSDDHRESGSGDVHGSGRAWTPAEDSLLGTIPDGEVAKIVGRSRGSVVARRHKLEIAAAVPAHRPTGTTGPPEATAR